MSAGPVVKRGSAGVSGWRVKAAEEEVELVEDQDQGIAKLSRR
jgi:hypothetical protein